MHFALLLAALTSAEPGYAVELNPRAQNSEPRAEKTRTLQFYFIEAAQIAIVTELMSSPCRRESLFLSWPFGADVTRVAEPRLFVSQTPVGSKLALATRMMCALRRACCS